MPLKKYLDYDGLAYLLQRFPKTTVHCTFDDEFAGETATLTHGTTTYTKTVPATSPFELTFAVNELGTWTLQCSYLGTQYSDTVDITYLGQKGEIELGIVPDGSTIEPVNSIPIWLKCANLNKSYTTLAEVLADTETYETLLADNNACQYMKRSTGLAGNPENLVPIMTSNTTPSGVVSAESFYSAQYAEYFAFNGSISNNGWTPNASATVGNTWIQYQFSEPTVISGLASFQYFPSGSTVTYRKKTTFKIQGSNNGTNFVDLGTDFETAYDWNIWSYSNFENNTAYEYYRIVMTAVEGTGSEIGPTSGNGYKFKLYVGGITTSQDAMARLGKFDYASNLLLNDDTWEEAIYNSDYVDYVYDITVPKMTSNTTPKGEVSASSVSSSNQAAYMAFDRDNSTYWHSAATPSSQRTDWLIYKFTSPVCIKRATLVTTSAPGPKVSKIKGSNDGINWTEIGDFVDCPSGGYVSYSKKYNNNNNYLYYAIFVDETNYSAGGNYATTFSELQFYGREKTVQYKATVPTMTGDTTPSGVASANRAHSSAPAWRAFDGESTDYWESDARGTNNDWVAYQHSEAKNIKRAYLQAVIQASNETLAQYYYIQAYANGEWITLATYTNSNTSSFSVYVTFDNPYTVTDYRVLISGPLGSNLLQKINRIQFYEEVTGDVILHSAANDTIYCIDGENNQIPICTTDEKGVGKCDLTNFQAGPVTLYSSVAKNPDDLTADYSKTITITKTQYGGTTEAYLMPDTIKTLYWWGNMANSGGFTDRGGSASSKTLNINTIDIELSVTSGTCAVGTNQTIDTNGLTKLRGIVKATNKGITFVSSPTLGNAPQSNSYGRTNNLTQNNTVELLEASLTDTGNVYTYLFQSLATNQTSKSNTYALWYE